MRKEKGQVPIIILAIVFIAIILFVRYFKPNLDFTPSVTPVSQEKTNITPAPKSPAEPPSYNTKPIADNASPLRFSPQPSGGLLSSTREVFIALNTDENATCRYATVSGVAYEYMQYTFSGAKNTFHSALITALNKGGSYIYYIKCIDEYGNKNSDDFVIAFWVNFPTDATPPVLSNAYPSGEIRLAGAFETMIGISTNEPASCRYSWTQGTSYNSMNSSLSADNTKQYHTANITGLILGKAYSYFVRCQDLSGNVNTGDVMISFRAMP
ncbi:MAG: hypothetical protein ABH841_01610 [Candidatus Nealsonbacteria bacterium]